MAYEVPDLPYDYNALEPHIDEQTMRIHHDKHHQAYVDKANAALEGTEWADKPVEEVLANLSSLPVRQAGPGAQQRRRPCQPLAVLDDPRPERRRHAQRRAGVPRSTTPSARFDAFKQQMVDAGVNRFGSGWSWLVVDNGAAQGRHQLGQPGLADLGRPDADARHRRVGARVLPEVPEQAARLPGRDLERDRLVGGRRALRQRSRRSGSRLTDTACRGGRRMRPPPFLVLGGGIVSGKTVVFFPEGAYGPTNNCVGIGEQLLAPRPPGRVHHRGVVRRARWRRAASRSALMRLGPPPEVEEAPGQFWKDFIRDTAPVFRTPTIEQLETLHPADLAGAARRQPLRRAAAEGDHRRAAARRDRRGQRGRASRRVVTADAPWVRIVSCNPLEMPDPELAPVFSGLPAGRPLRLGRLPRRVRAHATGRCGRSFDEFVAGAGRAAAATTCEFILESPDLNLYLYPRGGRLPPGAAAGPDLAAARLVRAPPRGRPLRDARARCATARAR